MIRNKSVLGDMFEILGGNRQVSSGETETTATEAARSALKGTLEVEVPRKEFEKFVDFVFHYSDFLNSYHLGNWPVEVAADESRGMLIADIDFVDDKRKAVKAWKAGKVLPEGFYAITRDVCLNAYLEGIKLYGMDWQESPQTDGRTYDFVFQMALFGKQVY